ncbi:MAG TPA: acyltransferase [Actinomycetota bacterium]|nr:acyltransferase [Actinomycetota bacterium]
MPSLQAEVGTPATGARLAYLDNLKTALIAGIIVSHGFNGYTEFGSWPYQDVQEVTISEVTETVFVLVLSFGSTFLMGLFFLISGLFTPRSLERKGVRRFMTDRLLRLGLPFAAFTLLLWPLLMYVVREPILHEGSYWYWFTEGSDPFLDNGPMWFIGVLLVFSLGYAAWRAIRPAEAPGRSPLRARKLVGVGAAIAGLSFVVRLWFPIDTGQTLNLHLWEWPQCLGMFLFGIACARRAWLAPVPPRIARGCGVVAVVAALSMPVLILTADPLGLDEEAYFGGFGWPSLATSILEGALAVSACVWVVSFAQQRLDRQGNLGRALSRSAYGAFLLQAPVLLGLALAMRTVDAPAEVKALVVAGVGVVASFALAWPLVTRTPLGRIL